MENIKLFNEFSNISKNEGRSENLKIKDALKKVKNTLKILHHKYTLDGNNINVFKNGKEVFTIIFNKSNLILKQNSEETSYDYDDIDNFTNFLQKKLSN